MSLDLKKKMWVFGFCVNSKFKTRLAFASEKGERMVELESNESCKTSKRKKTKPLTKE